jgi:membrane protein implicated in regulation of membrane protease activity
MGSSIISASNWGAAAGWWVIAGVLIAAELATGTFYLLSLAVGCAAGAIAAHVGLGSIAQTVVAAVVGGGSVFALFLKRRRRPREAPAASNRDVNLDIGNTVEVDHWDVHGPSHTTHVTYRGANWAARYEGTGRPSAGEHVIQALDGNVLILGR